ncbi:MAG: HNH endonuclease [Proteobacteria bacterium]|jgi:hypothetical protein|nr:HNH endonuclease [Pseudomonadota bacterium]
MKKIKLTQGKYAIVDDKDFEYLNQFKWSFSGRYAQRVSRGKHIYMHRLILDFPSGVDIDHINCDKLDNRKSNLRVCTRSQNNANLPKPSHNTSGYKGVSWDKRACKWVARLNKDGKLRFSKHFDNKLDAAKAYNEKITEMFGSFAKLNNIKEI